MADAAPLDVDDETIALLGLGASDTNSDGETPPAEDDAPGPKIYACDRFKDDGTPCDQVFPTSQGKATHIRFHHPAGGKKAPPADAPPSSPKPPRPSSKDKGRQYAASLAFYAGILQVAPGPFDITDLAIITKGAPQFGDALDAVADKHEAVRQWADLVLGGGAGGPYMALVMATVAMVLPILSHHGAIPEGVGRNAAQLLGGLDEAATKPSPPAAPASASADDAPPGGDTVVHLDTARQNQHAATDALTNLRQSAGHVSAVPRFMPGDPPLRVVAPGPTHADVGPPSL